MLEKKAVIYCRVSTDMQAEKGSSLADQEARGRQWCEMNGYEVIGVKIDAGISGYRSDNRPGFQEALDLTCKHKAALIVYSLSRFSRSVKDTAIIADRLDKAGADLVSLSEKIDSSGAAGRMIFRLLAVLNEFERDLISERVSATMSHLRRNNKRISRRVPFGYHLCEDGKNLIEDENEQEAIKLMVDLRASGVKYIDICREMANKGISPKMADKWTPKTIRGILLRQEKMKVA